MEVVLLLSSMHSVDTINETAGNAKKLEIFSFYNMTKITDLLDRSDSEPYVFRRTLRRCKCRTVVADRRIVCNFPFR